MFRIPARDPTYAHVFTRGTYEQECTQLIAGWMRRGDVVLDIGANHGWYSLLMAARVGDAGRVHAFEPVPAMATAWRRNADLNPQLHPVLHELALGDARGEVTMHEFAGLSHVHASASTLGRSDFTARVVPLARLEDVVGDDRPVFAKLDVEGLELAVLEGARSLIESDASMTWLIEVNYETAGAVGYEPRAVYDYLVALHPYEVYRVESAGLVGETDPARAPHGGSWLFVRRADRERVADLMSRHG